MSDQAGQDEAVTWRFLSDAESVGEAVGALEGVPVVGLDTETYWDAASRITRVSLVQIAPPAGEVLVIDAVAAGVEPVRRLLETPDVRMTAHNARFDQMVLRAAGVQPAGLVDTLSLARMGLSLSSYSLASVSEHLLGIPLDKTLRTSNWRRRPLTKAQIEYAATDARITLRVYEELRRLLEAEGRFETALRVSTLAATSAAGGARQRRMPRVPAFDLTAEEKRVVNRLKLWRLERAQTQRVPAYMVCPDRTLEHLARERPATLEALLGIHGLGQAKVSRFGEELLRALREACEEG